MNGAGWREGIPSDLSTSLVRAKIAARGVESCVDELIVLGWETSRTDLLVGEEGLIGGPYVKRVFVFCHG